VPDLSACREVRMEARVGVFGRGMASVKIQYFADGRPYGTFKARLGLRRARLAAILGRSGCWSMP